MGVRKNYRNLTDVERDRFVQALFHVKSTGVVDQFAEIHERHFFHTIHRSSHFLPWHREMLLRFERELQKFHPDVTIPYWDSTVDRSPSDPLWNNNFLGQFNSAWDLRRAFGAAPGSSLPTPQQVETNQGRGTYDAFSRELENPIHNRPHTWVGGVMNDFASPGDPVFYLHHCWIDLLWAQWQLAHPGAPFVPWSNPPGLAGVGLNDPLTEWPDRTPANVLDHHALGYRYDTEMPAEMPASIGNRRVFGRDLARNTKSIYAVTTEGRLAQVYDAEGWHLDFPAEAADSASLRFQCTPAVFGRDLALNLKSIYVATTEGRLAQVYDAAGWHLDFPAEAAGSPSLRFQGSPAVFGRDPVRNTKSIYAMTNDGRLAQIYDAEGWHLDFPAAAAGQADLRFQGRI